MKKLTFFLTFPLLLLILALTGAVEGQQCGPGSHWIDACSPGIDTTCDSYGDILIEFPANFCLGPLIPVRMYNTTGTIVRRNAPDTPGCSPPGHLCMVETEMLFLSLVGNMGPFNFTVTAGAGMGKGPFGNMLQPTRGEMRELSGDSYRVSSFFDIFTELEITGPLDTVPGDDTLYLYNHTPVNLVTTTVLLDRVPPDCDTPHVRYEGIIPICYELYTHPFGGVVIANLRHPIHVLPVELASFNSEINGRNVKLNWMTSSEQNNSGFEIQRKEVANEWVTLGFVKGSGNTNNPSSYYYDDINLNQGRYNYRLKQIDYSGNYNYFELRNEVIIGLPDKFILHQNFPNPFNPVTRIDFDLPLEGSVNITVYDINGKEAAVILNEHKDAGYHSVVFDGSKFASGVYYFKLESQGFVASRKMVMIK